MPEKVKIPLASFEMSANFTRPIVAIWLDRAVLVQAMFDAAIGGDHAFDNFEVCWLPTHLLDRPEDIEICGGLHA
jgi:hypothetical protein